MSYPPEFLKLVDEFIHLANRLAEDGRDGQRLGQRLEAGLAHGQ